MRHAGHAAAILLAVSAQARAATFAVIYTPPNGQGGHPDVSLLHNGAIYGVDPTAGASGAGTVFRVTKAGVYTVLHSFDGAGDGRTPNARLVMDKKGSIFGTTQAGGSANGGTIFRLPGNGGSLRILHTFQGGSDGANPLDGLAMNASGTLFGTTSGGDIAPGNGNLFSIVPGSALTVLHNFMSGADGHCPFTGVVIGPNGGPNGELYGTVVGMGFGGQPQGAIYDLARPSDTVSALYSFTNGADGEYPVITPTRDDAGNLFGLSTIQNGNPYPGAIWTYTLAGASKGFHVLYSFTGGADGYGPNGPLAHGSNGDFYGTTSGGGAGYGVVFQVKPSGAFTVLHSFTGGADGTAPTGSLALDSAGSIYGGTASGTVFKIVP